MTYVDYFLLELDESEIPLHNLLAEHGVRGLLKMYHKWLERSKVLCYHNPDHVDDPPEVDIKDAYETT